MNVGAYSHIWCVYEDDSSCSDRCYDEHTWVECEGYYIDVTADQFNSCMFNGFIYCCMLYHIVCFIYLLNNNQKISYLNQKKRTVKDSPLIKHLVDVIFYFSMNELTDELHVPFHQQLSQDLHKCY